MAVEARIALRFLQALFVLGHVVHGALECDPMKDIRKADPDSPEFYLYCNLEGSFSRKKCVADKVFSVEKQECESPLGADGKAPAEDDPFSFPHFQAPDDLCGAGIPLTILSAPVVCNPSISSCPDGYICRMYERTGTSYCCQNDSPLGESSLMCSPDQITYAEPISGKPRSCVLGSESFCPVGFSCNLVGGTTTRCCGKDFGCPYNSAAFVNPNTGSHVECNAGSVGECQRGFICVRSATFSKHICCSAVEQDNRNTIGESLRAILQAQCPNGDAALASPSTCDAVSLCPTGYLCTDGKCCPSAAVCPAGQPLGGAQTVCGPDAPCQDGYECVTTGGVQYCCPSRARVCSLARHAGAACAVTRPATTRFFFDAATGSCRSFQHSQCGGNANNFGTLEECEGFCVDRQCASGQPYRVGSVNAACAPLAAAACPRQFLCQQPLFGSAHICCPTPELTCNEMVSAGTPCFGRSVTIQRYYFNPNTRRCQPFQYYGCNGNGNNFESIEACDNTCISAVDSACGGVAPLFNPNNEVQRCSESVPCPAGFTCNAQRYCCPTAEMACNAQMSRGNVCAGSPQRSLWQFDNTAQNCRQFTYNGCGGTANRFMTQSACAETCVKAGSMGQCPRGMSPFVEQGETGPKACTLNVMGTCPPSASCVRSTANRAICCQVVTSCPDQRVPYYIPGSTSVVSCNIDGNDCPSAYVCLESSSVSGFNMCCSARGGVVARPGKRQLIPPQSSLGKGSPSASLKEHSPCPPGLLSTGETCNLNTVGECSAGESLCIRERGFRVGVCCRTPPPRCAERGHAPVFIAHNQVQICHADTASKCPTSSRCMTSSIPTVAICCRPYDAVPPRKIGPTTRAPTTQAPFAMATKSVPDMNNPLCRNSEPPYRDNFNVVHKCNFFQNTCPVGYKCEFSNTGQPVCCNDVESIRCPAGSASFEFGGRPLACPPRSTRCPSGYACVTSQNPRYHLCCSTGANVQPQCTRGVAYVDPLTSNHQYCNPLESNGVGGCPNGFHCLESTLPGQFICCTSGDISASFRGYCPPRQLPHIDRSGSPTTCHMSLHPCPNTAPYVCIYSAERQDSFCCAPIDTAVRMSNHITLSRMPTNNNAISNNLGNGIATSEMALLAGCPAGTRPLVDHARRIVECGIRPCPDGFACVYVPSESHWQCCSAGSILLKAISAPVPPLSPAAPTLAPSLSSASAMTNTAQQALNFSGGDLLASTDSSSPVLDCPFGFHLIDGKCIKVLYVGQRGCASDIQCSARESNATCDGGYCICPEGRPLVHSGKCVADCPAGFANIAGRCYDPTTVIFMDSVDERANGTIGGFCLDTLIEERRCAVENSYCSEKTITCVCKPGHELKMDFKNRDDKGVCAPDPSSKYAGRSASSTTTAEPSLEALLEPHSDEGGLYFVDMGPPPMATATAIAAASASSNGTELAGDGAATASSASSADLLDSSNSTTSDDAEDLEKYLFQSDQMIGVFA